MRDVLALLVGSDGWIGHSLGTSGRPGTSDKPIIWDRGQDDFYSFSL